MEQYDERLELAPRDIVARAIQDQMLTQGTPHVWLDISHKPAEEVRHHFPNIAARCAQDGIDITQDPIPVLPAQHYMCGGVHTGLLGETSVQGLYACGEVACTGLHGANRLASNSLLEGLVFADRAVGPSVAHAEYALRHCGRQLHYAAASADFRGPRGAREMSSSAAAWVAAQRERLKALMWRCAGIVRRSVELQQAQHEIAALYLDVRAMYKAYGVAAPLVELMNLVTVAELIVSCALQRRESRGLHYSADFPELKASEGRPSLISASFKARYDLDELLLVGAKGVKMVSSAGAKGVGGSGSSKRRGGAGAGAPASPGVTTSVREREVSVRSLPEE
jgi:L-aspartate oxidase